MPKVQVETTVGTRAAAERSSLESSSRAQRMLLIADLSGRASRGVCERSEALLERPLVRVNIDNFDQVLEAFAPRVAVPVGDPPAALEIAFRELDDFHPDSLRGRLDVLQGFASSRARLQNPATFEAEAKKLMGPASAKTEAASEAASGKPQEALGDTLQRLLGKKPATTDPRPSAGGATLDISRLLHDAVKPHIIADRSPQLDPMLESLQMAEAQQLREILHAPAFQRLEAAWRSIARLVNAVDDDGPAILLLDISEEELRNDLQQAEGPDRSALCRLLVQRQMAGADSPRWILLTADLALDARASDVACATSLGRIAEQAGAPFLAAARPSLFGSAGFDTRHADPADWSMDAEDAARWQTFRKDAAASWIGLVAPRVLLRLPYGNKTDPVDGAPFEEAGSDWSHEDYLWGSPAFACAALILGNTGLDFDDLPAHIDDGEMKPCAETLIGERAAQTMLSHGPMPWLSYRDRPAARLLRAQSVSDPATSLPGVTL